MERETTLIQYFNRSLEIFKCEFLRVRGLENLTVIPFCICEVAVCIIFQCACDGRLSEIQQFFKSTNEEAVITNNTAIQNKKIYSSAIIDGSEEGQNVIRFANRFPVQFLNACLSRKCIAKEFERIEALGVNYVREPASESVKFVIRKIWDILPDTESSDSDSD